MILWLISIKQIVFFYKTGQYRLASETTAVISFKKGYTIIIIK